MAGVKRWRKTAVRKMIFVLRKSCNFPQRVAVAGVKKMEKNSNSRHDYGRESCNVSKRILSANYSTLAFKQD